MENWLNPAALVSIATVFATIVGAIVAIVKERRAAPIDKKTVEMATTTAISNASRQTIEGSMMLNERLDTENKRLLDEAKESRHKVTVWETWYNVVVDQWTLLRQSDHAPDAPKYERSDTT